MKDVVHLDVYNTSAESQGVHISRERSSQHSVPFGAFDQRGAAICLEVLPYHLHSGLSCSGICVCVENWIAWPNCRIVKHSCIRLLDPSLCLADLTKIKSCKEQSDAH